MRAEGTTETEPEALKALAISIRTFALKNVGRHAKDGYDFCSTTHCQRFVRSPRFSNPDASGLLTVGLLTRSSSMQCVTPKARCCSIRTPIDRRLFRRVVRGHTADVGTLWGTTPPEYLSGVRDEYCDAGPHAKWIDTISRADSIARVAERFTYRCRQQTRSGNYR